MDADATEWLPRSGEVIAGRYRVERVIGEGGMGAVVAAEHVQLGGKVAIKFLHPKLAKDVENLERFIREAKATSRIKSEHVIRVLDVGSTEGGLPYIAMDLLEGADLGRVSKSGPMALQLAVDCVLQAADALAEAHAQGIVHRDIKPANLWLSHRRDGSPYVRVLDFGISKLMPANREEGGITNTHASFGSPAYMSPEQIRSAKHVDARTDVWALGVVLFELLSGSLPFDADNVAGILAAVISDPPRSLSALRPDLPPDVERVIRRCLERDIGRRYSLAEFALALRPFAGPAGQLAADSVARAGVPMASLIPPSNPASSPDLAFGKTEPRIGDRDRPTIVTRPRTGLLVAVGGGVTVAVLLLGIVAIYAGREPPARDDRAIAARPDPTPELHVPPPSSPAASIASAVPAVVAPPSASVTTIPPATGGATGGNAKVKPRPPPAPAPSPIAAPVDSLSPGRQ